MQTRPLLLLLCSTLATGSAADSGPRAHARGPVDSTTGVYTVVSRDYADSIAARFGLSATQLAEQNNLSGAGIRVGQRLIVTAASPAAPPAAAPATEPAPATAPTTTTAPAAVAMPPDPWPRAIQVADQTLSVYQPQVESWSGNRLTLRAAVAVKSTGKEEDAFGVIQAQARTQVDRVQRLVVLQDLTITKADFPTLPALAAALAGEVAAQFATRIRIIPLDRLEAALGASQADPGGGVRVQNPVPRIIMSTRPAVLVPIQGSPVLRPVAGTGFQRVINTRAVILTTGPGAPFYLHLLDGWVTAATLTGPWTQADITPAGLDDVASRLAAQGLADLLNGNPSTPTLALLAAGIPDVYVSETPTELIVFKGEPRLVPISGTGMRWAANTSADLILDSADSTYYLLMAGRWYRAPALQGPWTYVASTDLPADFRQIPADSPAGVVLAAVAGTPQAREAVIANSIPQTATVRRGQGPTFTPRFDGPATVSLLPDTQLEYVVNSETPIVRVNGTMYYALQAGVWFQSPSLDGHWVVADAVPDAVYTIPPSSPLHYITYVRVYGSTPEAVYLGYTPGYLGTVTNSDGVVVYGTGYDYQPWIGTDWYAAPDTFGLAAQPIDNAASGYGYGFGAGLATATAADLYWGGAHYRPDAVGAGCCLTTSANVYRRWGDTVAAGTRTWFDRPDGTLGTVGRGTYDNTRTGTTGDYAAGRSYNPDTGVAQRGFARTFDTAGGVDGAVARGERYDPATGTATYGARMTATGPEGSTVSRTTAAAAARPLGGSAAVHQTTVDDARTGEEYTFDRARVDDGFYAGADGKVYRSTAAGWQQHNADGWQDVGESNPWADREQQARNLGENRLSGGQGYGEQDIGGSGFGSGSGDRFDAGRFGSGGFDDHFDAGGFGGGFGGRFGGRR